MTKSREKTREELTAEIEDGKKKIRQFQNRERVLRQIVRFMRRSRCVLSLVIPFPVSPPWRRENPLTRKGVHLYHNSGHLPEMFCRASRGIFPDRRRAPRKGADARPHLAPADGFPNPMRGQCGHPTVRPVVTTDVKAVFGILRTKMYEKVYLLYIIYKKVLRVWHKYDKIKSKIMSSHICFPKNLFLP